MMRMMTTSSPMMPMIGPAFLPHADRGETMGALVSAEGSWRDGHCRNLCGFVPPPHDPGTNGRRKHRRFAAHYRFVYRNGVGGCRHGLAMPVQQTQGQTRGPAGFARPVAHKR